MRDYLGKSPSLALQLTFSDGNSGVMLLSSSMDWVAGRQSKQETFILAVGQKVVESGALMARRTITADADVRVVKTGVDRRQRDFDLDIRFYEPQCARLTIGADNLIVAEGPLTIKVLGGQAEVRELSAVHRRPVPRASKVGVLTLEDYVRQETGRIVRAAPEQRITDFGNTFVGLWIHVPQMLSVLEERLAHALDGCTAKRLNVLSECVTDGSEHRALATLQAASRLHARPGEEGRLFDAATHRAGPDGFQLSVVDMVTRLAEDRKMTAQFQLVDVDLVGSMKALNDRWIEQHHLTDQLYAEEPFALRRRGRPPQQKVLAAVKDLVAVDAEYCGARERTVAEQIQKYALTEKEDAVNLVLVGAHHAPLLDALPGAHPVYVTMLPASSDGAIASESLERMNARADLLLRAQRLYIKRGNITDAEARDIFLVERSAAVLGQGLAQRLPVTDQAYFSVLAEALISKLHEAARQELFESAFMGFDTRAYEDRLANEAQRLFGLQDDATFRDFVAAAGEHWAEFVL